MRITMNQAEIEAAITASIEAQGFNLAGKTVTIDLKATRGDAGYTAEIDIDNEGEAAPAPAKTRSLGIEKAVTTAKADQVEEPANDAANEAADAEEAEQAEAAEEQSEEAAPEPGTRKSLFGDQKRPANA